MSPKRDLRTRNFPTAEEDLRRPPPPLGVVDQAPSYRLAFADDDFLVREELRPVRMQLELLKPELLQQGYLNVFVGLFPPCWDENFPNDFRLFYNY